MPRPWTWFQKVQIGLPVLCISASLLLTGRGMMLGKRDERRAAARTLREERDAARRAEDPGQDEARLHVDPLQFSHLDEDRPLAAVTKDALIASVRSRHEELASQKL
mmetsp:Transcript_4633/g.11109  ORF Transcript_4633/g.11109 Transcript_4633/m.11109 type:complete len:107 (+) Transcript_4633:116-436(+)|eukprot:CAMPEP_0180214958 /NCGR_PEP_ID=MMETSP0987-20121128/15218_1 /TAXON_ID=697907 /ORGANISM="non described non described, Strain CCMP2293" /LENGTH=106 /DNA_ID=CAMNT_0022173541 /DNA_START=107 /DNA_END=427 /DNA_ORIENTATION=-